MSNKLLVALTVVAGLALTIPFVARTENITSSVPSEVMPVEATPVQERDISRQDEPQVVSLQVTPHGFEPIEIIARPGKFLILLQNRTGRRDLSFYLRHEHEARLADSEPQKRDWKVHVQLGPGTYIVGETNHPEWRSLIRVTD